MYSSGYPTTRFTWKDNSGASSDVLFSAPTDGLCVPFAFVLAERGEPGAINFGGAAELTKILGAATFDPTSPYFNPATQFLGYAMAGQGVEVMRLVDPDATTANIGLFLEVVAGPLVQYQKDPSGDRLIDNNGHYIPQLQPDGVTQVTALGITVKWTTRALASNEYFDTLTKKTVSSGGTTTTIYPIMGFQVSSPGVYGNRQGFMLYSTTSTNASLANALNSVLYRFIPMELPTAVSTTATAITDLYGLNYNDISFKPNAVYGGTNSNYSAAAVLNNSYIDKDTGVSSLPYKVHTYGTNIGLVGAAVLAVSPELAGTDPYLIDLMSGADLSGNLYDHLAVSSASQTVVSSSAVQYATGGTDGNTSWTKFESLVSSWLAGSDHGEFSNLQQHPMTHFYDPGFSMSTKTLLFNMLNLRDNFKIDVTTQDVSLPVNTKAEDISAGQVLLFRAQMHPESVIQGVPCCRVGIYAHSAELISGSPLGGPVPFTLNRLIQRRNLDGGTYIKGSSGGLPNSQVTLFRKPNWVADDEVSQSLTWSGCINAVRHASRTVVFYPSIRTVYTNDTSLLSDDEFSDRVIYAFKICRAIWAKYAGVRKEAQKLFPLIQNDLMNELNSAFATDNIKFIPTVFQTAADANLGYQISVNLAVTGNLPLRTMNFNVIVGRSAT